MLSLGVDAPAIIPSKISGVLLLNNKRKKKPTKPIPMTSNKFSFLCLEESHAVNNRPAKIMTQRTLAVICDIDSGSRFVSLK